MKISDVINIANPAIRPQTSSAKTLVVEKPSVRDNLEISEAMQRQIDRMQQGSEALKQAVVQSRQSIRSAAAERVSYAKEYLRVLASMSLPGDRGAANEAARMAREIKNAAADFRGSIGDEELADARSEIAGFADEAGKALKIAKGLVENYLRKRIKGQDGDDELRREVDSAISVIKEMVMEAMQPA